MKKKLLVILGAGSSSALGFPSVQCLDPLMAQWGSEWAKSWETGDHFDELWQSAETYYKRGPTGPRPVLNFERVLGDMVAMAHWMEAPPWGNTLMQAACDGVPPPRMTFRHQSLPDTVEEVTGIPVNSLGDECDGTESGDEEVAPSEGLTGKYGAYIELMSEYSFLLGKLARHMRAESEKPDSANTTPKDKYRNLLAGLRERFNVGVYNLNYDTAALDALPGAYTGFGETGSFEPSIVHERREWDFVYHLHGSVHHSLNCRYVGDKIVWRPSLDAEFFDDPEGQWTDKLSEGRRFPRTTLVAGGFKLDQLLVEPFQSFHASLVRHVYAADAILIGGYGFGDAHVNWALRNRFGGTTARPSVPVMLLALADDRTDPMAFRNDDLWAIEVCRTFGANGHSFVEPDHSSPPVPADLASRGAFEVDTHHRVAIWHGGFIEAERRVPSIAQWLDGGADNALVPDPARGV
jgi:SIR2-like domain